MKLNKKGMLGFLIGTLIIILVITSFLIFYFHRYPQNRPICEEDFKMYQMNNCVSYLEDIRICHSLNATWVRTEIHFFSSNVIICYKDGEILRV